MRMYEPYIEKERKPEVNFAEYNTFNDHHGMVIMRLTHIQWDFELGLFLP